MSDVHTGAFPLTALWTLVLWKIVHDLLWMIMCDAFNYLILTACAVIGFWRGTNILDWGIPSFRRGTDILYWGIPYFWHGTYILDWGVPLFWHGTNILDWDLLPFFPLPIDPWCLRIILQWHTLFFHLDLYVWFLAYSSHLLAFPRCHTGAYPISL